jgi:hypothetical protein
MPSVTLPRPTCTQPIAHKCAVDHESEIVMRKVSKEIVQGLILAALLFLCQKTIVCAYCRKKRFCVRKPAWREVMYREQGR